jgi:hypothetical protein
LICVVSRLGKLVQPIENQQERIFRRGEIRLLEGVRGERLLSAEVGSDGALDLVFHIKSLECDEQHAEATFLRKRGSQMPREGGFAGTGAAEYQTRAVSMVLATGKPTSNCCREVDNM